MKLQKKNQPLLKRPATWLVLAVALLAVFVILEKTQVTDFIKTPISSTPQGPTPEQQRQEALTNAGKKQDLIEEKTGTKESTTSSASSNTSIDISAKQETNSSVTVITKLFGYSGGSCSLKITNGAKSTTQTADAMYQSEFASCAGFSVPVDTVGKGLWSIKLTVTVDGRSQEKVTTLEVK